MPATVKDLAKQTAREALTEQGYDIPAIAVGRAIEAVFTVIEAAARVPRPAPSAQKYPHAIDTTGEEVT